ncbi:hypothetical protein [Emticicia sp. 21SJ11W-3]|uniref:hypothetical protein n=1 Tax=Emticicia sp. 21SJ11W-3 TaxID=2916755 RepID=UPI00209CF00A|nr:hypothetical protein [Emticicia sp. 21SJ11W-3]UTA69857.1 hypothetical protein MB380_08590 [Emticicia sp. 21SJ11W-3]
MRKLSVEQEYIAEIVKAENIQAFTIFSQLTDKLIYENKQSKDSIQLLNSQLKDLHKIIRQKDEEIKKLKLKQRNQEFIEKNKEIKKESVKIVANKVRQSEEKAQLKKTIEDLIREIDVCVELLNED